MQGYYGVYYTGATGSAALGLILHDGKVCGVDPAGGDVSGSYVVLPDGTLSLSLLFNWPAGGVMVTGQTLTAPLSVPATLTIAPETLNGADQTVDLPIGRVNLRIQKKLSL